MHSSAMGWFSRTSIVVAVVMIAGGARLTAQTADSVPHVRPHGMAWGRETFVLSEVLDYSPAVAARSLDYDVVAWSGGAVNRLWLKVDGGIATRGQAMHGEYQVLYGRLVSVVGCAVRCACGSAVVQWQLCFARRRGAGTARTCTGVV